MSGIFLRPDLVGTSLELSGRQVAKRGDSRAELIEALGPPEHTIRPRKLATEDTYCDNKLALHYENERLVKVKACSY